jgi:hypothetical protein
VRENNKQLGWLVTQPFINSVINFELKERLIQKSGWLVQLGWLLGLVVEPKPAVRSPLYRRPLFCNLGLGIGGLFD